MAESGSDLQEKAPICNCFTAPQARLVTETEPGMDEHFAQVTLLRCPDCGQRWLQCFYEVEAFTASGRWYRGAISAEQAEQLTAGTARATLEGLNWYFWGGSYFGGKSGRGSGKIYLSP